MDEEETEVEYEGEEHGDDAISWAYSFIAFDQAHPDTLPLPVMEAVHNFVRDWFVNENPLG